MESEHPFGPGLLLQVPMDLLESTLEALHKLDWRLVEEPGEGRHRGSVSEESGSREFLAQDPDGYPIRFAPSIGRRRIA